MYKRKTYIINKEFQYGFIATFLIIIIVSLLIFSGGFFLYYLIKDTVGEWKFEEFIDIKQETRIRIQPIKPENIVKPYELAVKLQNPQDLISSFVKTNVSPEAQLLIDSFDKETDSYEMQTVLAKALSQLLELLVSGSKDFTKKEIISGIRGLTYFHSSTITLSALMMTSWSTSW